jgi:hypothetical protein
MKELEALSEHPTLVVVFDTEALPGVQSPKTRFQLFENVLIERGINATSRFFAELKIHLFPLTHPGCAARAKPTGSFQRGIASKIAANPRRGRVNSGQRRAPTGTLHQPR